MKIMKLKSTSAILVITLILLTTVFTGCKKLLLPSSQVWVITFANCNLGTCGTNVTILKGGAISQKDKGVKVPSSNIACAYYAPISGQWSGTIFKFTMNGGACGEQLQGFTQGTAEGEYGTATTAQGSITWTFNNRGPISDTWTARLLY